MRKFCFIILSVTLAGLVFSEEKPLPIWAYANVWPRHNMLRQQLIEAIRRGDIPAMETTCRSALEFMPGDSTWHYNLACALAYREQAGQALAELEKAILFGFRDAAAIEKDQDFSRINTLPRFKELVQKARDLADKPVPGRPVPAPCYAATGGTATLSETNVVFNFDTGVYDALLQLAPPKASLAEKAATYSASQPNAREKSILTSWLVDGSAAGNIGDIYINRDLGHSMLATGDFPLLTTLRLTADAKPFRVDVNHPNLFVGNAAVFGNISRGYTTGPFWRSMARASFTEPGGLATRMDLLYRSNQFWVIPCVNDFGKPELGDVFPANAPFQFISEGASWSDQPFLRAALAASAALAPQTKKAILRRKLVGPTLQWLLRRTMQGIRSESDYLSPRAHPTAFNAKRLDTVALIEKAHALKPENIPPAVNLAVINSRLFPIRFPVAGVDYPDTVSEVLFATSSAISFVLRSPAGERTFLIRAQTFPEQDPLATFTWKVVHGDPSAVKISAPLGETLNTPERGFAQITIDRRTLKDRIDVACFAKTHGTDHGAPSIVSFYPVPQETRVYRPDGKIESIDYSNPALVYCDPALALPRRWKDTYTYSPAGKLLGFTRSYNGKDAASFAPTGERVIEKNADGTARRVVRVKYTARQTGNQVQPLELTYTDDGEPFDVK